MIHQKTAQNAVAAVSRLAELYRDPNRVASSRDIAESRGLPAPLVAKILTVLSHRGLITGSPGPGGGYRLAVPPDQISLHDVVSLFERESQSPCPYGPKWCGEGDPCPLHDSMVEMKQVIDDYLANTTFAAFEHTEKGTTKGTGPRTKRKAKASPRSNTKTKVKAARQRQGRKREK